MLKRIVSGGQTGADKGGLLAGKALGLQTGGWAPKGWKIQDYEGNTASDPTLAEFGLQEHKSSTYPPRTRQNVIDADGTVWIGYESSGGGKLTIGTAKKHKKPLIINPSAEELRAWVEREKIETLNVAGNRLSDFNPNIEQEVYQLLVAAFGPTNSTRSIGDERH